jgi:hypothetical protein
MKGLHMWKVRAFGSDCLGNCTGWVVERYVWEPSPDSQRADGLTCNLYTAGQFVGDIYKPAERELAKRLAEKLASELNAA